MPDARLEVVDSEGRRLVPLTSPRFTIGRSSASDLTLTGTDVSRDHAEISQLDGDYVIKDRRSRCGTFVNGTPVMEHTLSHGDRIKVGRSGVELRFLIHSESPGSHTGSSIIVGFRQIATLLNSLRALGSARVLDEVLALVMDAAIDVTGAERGFIMLANDAGDLELKLARAQGRISLTGAPVGTSRKIPEQVFATAKMQIVPNLLEVDDHVETIAHGIRHVLCVPLRLVRFVERSGAPSDARSIGVLYLDSREKGELLSHTATTALETLATEAAVAIENARLYRQSIEKARIDEDLRLASQIQQALLPQSKRAGGFFEAMGTSIACRTIGGDFFDYLESPDGSVGLVLGDVSGKGPPAALLTAVLQGIFSAQTFAPIEPDVTMTRVNRALLARGLESRFATVFLGVLTPGGQLTYSNAGHNPPLLVTSGAVQRLETGGMLLGLFAQAQYEEQAVQLEPGDLLVVFSDGVSEALNEAGEEFGEDRIREITCTVRSQPVETVLQSLLAAVQTFTKGMAQNDDVTAMVVRYLGPPGSIPSLEP
jgi:serine phosphatase RsbU (regulator of sigma subunit)